MSKVAVFLNGIPGAGKTSLAAVLAPELGLPEVARGRFHDRPRHHAHADQDRLAEWEQTVRAARPISRFPTVTVNTSDVVDVDAVATQIRRTLDSV